MESEYLEVLWLGHPDCHNLSLVGGKAANLSRMAAQFLVPPGFCLTTVAYDRAIATVSPSAALAPSDAAHSVGPGINISPELQAGLVLAYQALAERCGVPEPGVAVRSSAVDEDGNMASFAGQHETFLNIAGIKALADAVVRCWASAHADRALEYRRQQGLALDNVRLAVLVQQLVIADVAAVVFSANPVTGNRDEVVINASWGLGESIVGGTVTPDTVMVRKSDLAVLMYQIADKRRMTVAVADGTKEVDIPRILRKQPALEEGQAAEMARLAVDLEQVMGWPVDIECAFQGGRLYLLQCRPITTLAHAA
ncbi:MAG: hypothetical protein EXR62_08065 [Chloroflexi bacterium]|nr:hypothetical protein [Chloroflexota bacterium]